jgi:hypothetical protein
MGGTVGLRQWFQTTASCQGKANALTLDLRGSSLVDQGCVSVDHHQSRLPRHSGGAIVCRGMVKTHKRQKVGDLLELGRGNRHSEEVNSLVSLSALQYNCRDIRIPIA